MQSPSCKWYNGRMLLYGLLLAALPLVGTPQTPTVADLIAQSVDSRIAGKDPSRSLRRLAGKLKLNPDFWGREIDFSCISPRNDRFGGMRGGVAVSLRHVLFANHFPIPVGTRLHFIGNDGEVCTCSVDATRPVPSSDVGVGLLNAELTPNIHPAKILPDDFTNYVGTVKGLPCVVFDAESKGIVADVADIPANPKRWAAFSRLPADPGRAAFGERIVVGDSGQPCFLIVGTEPVLLYTMKMGGGGAGPAVHLLRHEIQRVMDELCPGYKLESFDFSTVGKKKSVGTLRNARKHEGWRYQGNYEAGRLD